jgi:hypothetical protein
MRRVASSERPLSAIATFLLTLRSMPASGGEAPFALATE